MRIALDATPLSVASGGVRRYTEQLALALASEFPEDEILLASDQPVVGDFDWPSTLRCEARARAGAAKRWWLAGLPAALARFGADVFHGTDFSVPYAPLRPAVMTLHDLSPWKAASWRASSRRVRRRTPLLLGLGLAAMVITPGENVRREAIYSFGLHPSRVVAIPLAAASCFRPVAGPPPERPYFLFVGTVEPRKNVEVILDAWRALSSSRGADLVLVGRLAGNAPPLPQLPGLRLAGMAGDGDLAALYSHASALLMPSWYEGFGLPVLEAMQCGAPVIASSAPALREAAGDAAILLDAGCAESWREAMRAVLENAELAARMRERSLRRAALFSWAQVARNTRDVYQEAIRRFA